MRYGLTSYIQQKMKKKRLDELFLKMFFGQIWILILAILEIIYIVSIC
mgnify:CR=1 FL=1